MRFTKLNHVVHRWGSILTAVPVLIIIATGAILQLKKQIDWVQPPTRSGTPHELAIPFDQILDSVRRVPEAAVTDWADIDRLDVRPDKGVVKVRCRNWWEIQLDTKTGEVLQVAYRRSDLIEQLHDGSFFSEPVKLWIFLPAGIFLGVLWATGVYLFLVPYVVKRKRRKA